MDLVTGLVPILFPCVLGPIPSCNTARTCLSGFVFNQPSPYTGGYKGQVYMSAYLQGRQLAEQRLQLCLKAERL